jgi:hemerythrin superfamily protein
MPKTKTPTRADGFARLEQDHRDVEALFERLQTTRGNEARERVFRQLKEALTLHATLEEHILYLAIRSLPDGDAQASATLAFDEHEDVKSLLAQLETTSPHAPEFLGFAKVLEATVARHVQHEEEELFPMARRMLDADRQRQLAERLDRARAEHRRAASEARSPAARS